MTPDPIRPWLESLGWEAVEDMFGAVTGYRYGERTYIDLATAENWWRIRETCPFGPPRF